MIFNTTSAEVLDKSLESQTHFALIRQFLYGSIGIFIGYFVWKMGYKDIVRLSPFLLFLCICFLALVFIPGVGQEINGAKRWIGFGGLTLQPSEFAKYLIPMYFIYRVTNNPIRNFFDFIKILIIFLIPLGLILLEPDNGTTALILFTLVIVFFITKIRWTYWVIPLASILLIGGVIAFQMPHVKNRLTAYLHPELDIKGKGHQPYQARIATGSGRLFGKGLGASMQKLNYLPEARSDYLAAIYAEEFGFIGICFLICLYMLIAYEGFNISINSQDKKGFYVGTLLTFMISFQAFLNLGVVSGLLPSKGITLPFFSQGGTSLISHMIAISLLVNIAKPYKKKITNES